ncbi:MAG: uracil-DNA glycosylase [Rhizobacter sp.]|nr:uracil-DNA glycosylase [Rhizobacter sp.]
MTANDNRLVEPLSVSFDRVEGGWRAVTEAFRRSPVGEALIRFVDERVSAGAVVYPGDPLRALACTPLEAVRVVLLGQDPYHGPGQAEGLAFSVPHGVRPPPSLRNIFKEMQRDLGLPPPASGHLGAWTRKGVLLLNTTLTVEDALPASHATRGWEVLTDALITAVAQKRQPVAFLLWGSHAQKKRALIEGHARAEHRVLVANHPSPLSATRGPLPFIGSGHFSSVADRFASTTGSLPRFDWTL